MTQNRSICAGGSGCLGDLRCRVDAIRTEKLFEAPLRWRKRYLKLRSGDYKDQKTAVYDITRLCRWFGFRDAVIKEKFVKAVIRKALKAEDVAFFEQFVDALRERQQSELNGNAFLLMKHWANALNGLPEFCSLNKKDLATVLNFDLERGKKSPIHSAKNLAQQCWRLGLPPYRGKKMRVEKKSGALNFTRPNGTGFLYPDPEWEGDCHFKWPDGKPHQRLEERQRALWHHFLKHLWGPILDISYFEALSPESTALWEGKIGYALARR